MDVALGTVLGSLACPATSPSIPQPHSMLVKILKLLSKRIRQCRVSKAKESAYRAWTATAARFSKIMRT